MAEDHVLSHWVSAIPEAHYDFLAWVFPGLISLFLGCAAYIVFQDHAAYLSSRSYLLALPHSSLNWAPAIIYVMLALVFSWCIGMLLDPFGNLLHEGFFKYRVFRKVAEDYCKPLTRAVDRGVLIFETPPTWDNVGVGRERKLLEENTHRQLHALLRKTSPNAYRLESKKKGELKFYINASAALILHLGLIVPSALFLAHLAGIHSADLISVRPFGTFLLVFLPILLLAFSLWGQRSKQLQNWERHLSVLNGELDKRAVEAPAAQNVVPAIAENPSTKPQSLLDILRRLIS